MVDARVDVTPHYLPGIIDSVKCNRVDRRDIGIAKNKISAVEIRPSPKCRLRSRFVGNVSDDATQIVDSGGL